LVLPPDGYYHVKTRQGEDGYVWSKNIHVAVTPITTAFAGDGVNIYLLRERRGRERG
jgi:flagellar basal body rod protein FlgF